MNLNEVRAAAKRISAEVAIHDGEKDGAKFAQDLDRLARFAAALLDETISTPDDRVLLGMYGTEWMLKRFGTTTPTRGQLAALRLALGMEIE